jgi:hypothetical protein
VDTSASAGAEAASFASEMDYVLKKKLATLQLLDGDGTRLVRGARVRHASYGEGMILSSESRGKQYVVRINFFNHGTMALILSPDDVGTA